MNVRIICVQWTRNVSNRIFKINTYNAQFTKHCCNNTINRPSSSVFRRSTRTSSDWRGVPQKARWQNLFSRYRPFIDNNGPYKGTKTLILNSRYQIYLTNGLTTPIFLFSYIN
jgi:hypothetical protein